jgi:N-hydroxyarylamine O-acetyltransferase
MQLAVMLKPQAYLDRISYTGPTAPTAETLRALHRAHMLTVPFENLDISLGRTIVCDESSFLRKIIERHRGGFCYELNGAFAWLLRELGFKVTLLSARVPRADGSASPEFDHLTLRVDLGADIEDPWLADVGFGDLFLEPIQLKPEIEQRQGRRAFRIKARADELQLEMLEPSGEWRQEYSFTLQPLQLADFAGMCHFHQTSPQSHFTQNRICSMATPDGRVTLSNDKLIVTQNEEREERVIESDEERRSILQQNFGVTL